MIPVIGGRATAAHHGREGTVSTAVHVALALVLTLVLAGQAGAFTAVLRSRRALASRRPPRRTELVWVVIPVAVVLFLAARSWIIALDLGSPAVATVAPVNVSARPVSPPIFHR
jgi:heme/copper-type cytochrome/quinol oxidase subunit 2